MRLVASLILIVGGSLAIAACGGGGESSGGGGPFAAEIVSCLEHRGLETEVKEEGGFEAVFGRAEDGSGLVVINLPEPDFTGRDIRELKEKVKKELKDKNLGGMMVTSTANEGFTLVGVIGVEGVDGGVPSSRSESLARACATRTRT